MQDIQPIQSPPGTLVRHTSLFRRLVWIYAILLLLLLLALVPPLVSVNRLQRRIASSISQSLGRPVHLDSVSLDLLPMPGFTLQNFVVSEDPAFGAEPVIRANTVTARLRLRSLWTRRVEFSTISFTDPSVNLVHLPNGKWNLQSILLQASRIQAAPTAQRTPGQAPRFPYIEATGARINLKQGLEKTPFSLTDADFALWLPNPEQWHLRLEAHPVRTDTSASDTGTLQLEGTLGRAPSLDQVPIDLTASWHKAPLGEASTVLLGHDADLRGTLDLSAHILGTVGDSTLTSRVQLADVRRADFVPQQSLDLDLTCTSPVRSAFHSFPQIRCDWPNGSATPALSLAASLPDIRSPRELTASLQAHAIPAPSILNWLRVASSRIPPDTTLTGTFDAALNYGPPGVFSGNVALQDAILANPTLHLAPLPVGNITLRSATPLASAPSGHGSRRRPAPATVPNTFTLLPVTLPLGASTPATLEGSVTPASYTLHLSGPVLLANLRALADALPQLGDGLSLVLPAARPESSTPFPRPDAPVRLDLTATRTWPSDQIWKQNTPSRTPPARPRHYQP